MSNDIVLQQWYEQQRRRASHSAAWTKLGICVFFLVAWASPPAALGALIVFTTQASFFSQQEGLLFLAVLYLLQANVYIAVVWWGMRRIRAVQREVKHGTLTAITDENAPHVRRIFDELLQRTQQPHECYDLWYVRSNNISPSVVEIHGRAQVLVPRGLVRLSSTDPEQVRAMFAHELGHVMQRDTGTWVYSDIFCRAVYVLAVLTIMAYTSDSVITQYKPWDEATAKLVDSMLHTSTSLVLGTIGIVGGLYRYIVKQRRHSEELADTAAILYADGSQLIRALQEQATEALSGKVSPYHPRVEWRIERIRQHMRESGCGTGVSPDGAASYNE